MSDEIQSLVAVSRELGPAASEFAAAVGRTGPVSEFLESLTEVVRYRWRLPRLARLLTDSAEQIRASGLPPAAIPDRLLRDVLEELLYALQGETPTTTIKI